MVRAALHGSVSPPSRCVLRVAGYLCVCVCVCVLCVVCFVFPGVRRLPSDRAHKFPGGNGHNL